MNETSETVYLTSSKLKQ